MSAIVQAILTTLVFTISLWLSWTVDRCRHENDIPFTFRLMHPTEPREKLRRRVQASRRGRGR